MARRALTAGAWLTLAAALGCGDLPPVGHVRLAIDTDAIVPPPADGVAAATSVPALFDTLVVDVYEPDAPTPCEGCSRAFAIDDAQLRARAVSLLVPAESGADGYVARLRLYHSASSLTGEVPAATDVGPPSSVIDRWVSLPVVAQEGAVDAHVVLATDDVGLVVGSLEAPVSTEAGAVAVSRVGSWSGAVRRPCAAEAGPREVCVPGGAFWMGHPRALGVGLGDAWNQRRLVTLDPFFVDQDEVTVAEWRQFDPTGALVTPWTGELAGNAPGDFCTFTPTPGPKEAHPIVCLRVEDARAYCQAHGKELPTEAQLEYVAGGLESRLFVWGSDEPACEDAVLRRYGYGLFYDFGLTGCLPSVPPGGAEPVGGSLDVPRRDRLVLAGGTIHDLVGNVSEWVLDRWNRQSEPCWSQGGVYDDPVCLLDSPADGPYPVYRMGSYAVGARQALAAARSRITSESALQGNGIDLGFRCVRPGI